MIGSRTSRSGYPRAIRRSASSAPRPSFPALMKTAQASPSTRPLGGVVGTVEEVLHAARELSEVLRGAEGDRVRPQQIGEAGVHGAPEMDFDPRHLGMPGAPDHRPGHRLRVPGLSVIDDEQVFQTAFRSLPSTSSWSSGVAAARMVPSERAVSGSPSQSVMTPPAPVTTGARASRS